MPNTTTKPYSAKKAAYNKALSDARANLTAAMSLRKSLIAEDGSLTGPSVKHLESAITSAYSAKTFDGYTGDIPSKDNTFRKKAAAPAPATARNNRW